MGMHAVARRHVGAVFGHEKGAQCVACGWTVSARLDQHDERGAARFGLLALSSVGASLELAVEALRQDLATTMFQWLTWCDLDEESVSNHAEGHA